MPKGQLPRLPLYRRRGHALAVALLTEPTVKRAAEVAGVDHTTVFQWIHFPEFQQELRTTRDALRAALIQAAVAAGKVEVVHPATLRALEEAAPSAKPETAWQVKRRLRGLRLAEKAGAQQNGRSGVPATPA